MPTTFQQLSSQLAELKKKYPNNKYEFPVFNPNSSDISTTPAGCRINASSVSNVGQVDIAPTMNLISDKLYTPQDCKMEAGILKSTPQFKSAPLYYSIVEKTPEDSSNNLFQCYTYSGDITAPIQNPDPAKYSVNVMEQPPIWSAISDPSNIQPGNYATINVNGDLVIKNVNNTTSKIVVKAVNPVTTLTKNYTDCYYKNYTKEIDDWAKENELLATCNGGKQVAHWNYVGSNIGYNPFCNVKLVLFEENQNINLVLKVKGTQSETNYVIFSKPIPPDVVGNYNWYLEQKAGTPHFIDQTGKGQIHLQSSIISNECKFKLKISNEGNLVLVYCKESCITDKSLVGDIRQYSQEKDARFLNLVDVPKEFNHIYYKTIDNQMKEVPTNSKILSYDNHLYPDTPTFTPYNGYVPRDLTQSQTMSANDCKEKCKKDPNCDYYYNYTQDNVEYCQSGKNTSNNIIPSGVFNSAKQHPNIPSDKSTLNIRNKKVDLPVQSMARDPIIPMNYTNDYATYSTYPISDSAIESFSTITEGLTNQPSATYTVNRIKYTTYQDGKVCRSNGNNCSKQFITCDIKPDNSAICKDGRREFSIKNNKLSNTGAKTASYFPKPGAANRRNVYSDGIECKPNSCSKQYISCDIKPNNKAVCKNESIINNIKSEILYTIKNYKMTSNTKPVPTPAPTTPTPTPTYNQYGTNSEQPVKDVYANINNMFKTENFNPSICTSDNPKGCNRYISDNIQSLNNTHLAVGENSSKINSNYNDLSNTIDEYNESRAELNSDARYEFTPSAGINQTVSRTLDVANEDINEMILHQNNMYILGTVTSASLLIAAIMLSGSN